MSILNIVVVVLLLVCLIAMAEVLFLMWFWALEDYQEYKRKKGRARE